MSTEQAATTAIDNVTALRTGYAAFAAGDLPVVLALLAPDVEWTEVAGGPTPGTFRGPDAVVEGVFAPTAERWSEFRLEPEEFIGGGDRVVVLGTVRGTWRATGKAMTARFVHLYRFRDGRAVHFEEIADSATMAAAMA